MLPHEVGLLEIPEFRRLSLGQAPREEVRARGTVGQQPGPLRQQFFDDVGHGGTRS